MRLLPLTAIALPLLAACMPQPPAALPAPVADCRAGHHAGLVGRPLASFDTSKVAGPVRILAPGSAMTMDHNPGRLNIHHDRQRIITQVTCG
ncbi:I78 family peptidase inhibitor [Gemmobacter sp.]|uniref:I78 family peptidase inhibitor n=1 Tax=Gemmobacter sp. TaxID=1898957 RepID=UPI002AFECCF1|nr:I78 family peptidase inhibitor [Gemmobacter sp.]